MVQTYEFTATVTSIDKASRKVTLVDAAGIKTTVKAGPEIINFDQIRVGDQLKITATEELVVSWSETGETPTEAGRKSWPWRPRGPSRAKSWLRPCRSPPRSRQSMRSTTRPPSNSRTAPPGPSPSDGRGPQQAEGRRKGGHPLHRSAGNPSGETVTGRGIHERIMSGAGRRQSRMLIQHTGAMP